MTPGRIGRPRGGDAPREATADHRDHFDTSHLEADLGGRSVRGGAVTVASQGARFALQLGSTAVLARLLTPEDFGLVAMVTAIAGLVILFKDAGLSMATVQRAELTHGQVSSMFWVNVAVSACLAVVFAALAPLVAAFYGDARLTLVTVLISCGFAFGGLATQHTALLRRKMRFTALAGAEVGGMAAGVSVAIVLGWVGAGYWALVAMHMTTPVALTAITWALCDWRPGRPSLDSEVRGMLAFGGNLTGSNLLHYVIRHVDNVLIGWWWGAGPVGLYQRAYSLLLLPINQVNRPVTYVAVPALSRLQHDLARFRRHYFSAIRVTVFFGMPLVAFSFVAAEEIVLIVLGSQWVDAIAIFRYLAPAGFVSTFYFATSWVYIALGYTHRQLRWTAVNSVVTVAALVAGLPFGPEGVAIAFSGAVVGLRPFAVAYCYRPTGLRPRELAAALVTPALASLAAAAVAWAAAAAWSGRLGLLAGMLATASVYGVVYLGLLAATPGGRRLLGTVRRASRNLRNPRRSPNGGRA